MNTHEQQAETESLAKPIRDLLHAHQVVLFDQENHPYKAGCACGQWFYDSNTHRALIIAEYVTSLRVADPEAGGAGRPARYDHDAKVWRDMETGDVVPSEPDAAWIAGGLD